MCAASYALKEGKENHVEATADQNSKGETAQHAFLKNVSPVFCLCLHLL